MADSPILPGVHAWKDAGGRPLPAEFFRFLRDLVGYVRQVTNNDASLTEILERIDALEAAGNATIQGVQSVVVQGTLAGGLVNLLLRNDVANPGNSYFYGTDESGVKGWFERTLATLSDVDLTGLVDGDAIVWDAGLSKFVPGEAGGVIFNRITDSGDVRVTTQGDLRATD